MRRTHPYMRPSSPSSTPSPRQPAVEDDILKQMKRGLDELLHSPSASRSGFGLSSSSTSNAPKPTSPSFSPKFDLYVDPEISNLKKEIRIVKEQANETKVRLEERIIALEQEGSEKDQQIKQAQQRILKLEKDRRYLLEEEQKLKEQLEEKEKDLTTSKRDFEEKMRGLRAEHLELKEAYSELRERSRARESEQQIALDLLKIRLSKRELELAEVTQAQAALNQQAFEGQVQELQARVAEEEAKARALESKLAQLADYEILKTNFEKQMSYFRNLEAENKTLQKENSYLSQVAQKAQLLVEEKNSLQTKARYLEEFRDKCSQLEIKVTLLEKEKAQWASFLEQGDKREFDSPAALSKKLGALRRENALLREQLGDLHTQLRARGAAVEDQIKITQNLKAEKDILESQRDKDLRAIKRLEKMRSLHQKEVEFLRAQLDSFDGEQTILVGGQIDKSKTERIQHLEQLVLEHKQALEEQQQEIAAKDAEVVSLLKRVADLANRTVQETPMQQEEVAMEDSRREESNKLKLENEQLKEEIKALDQQIAILEQRVSEGDFNPKTTKVLHFTMNPERIAQEERNKAFAALKAENEQLLKTLQEQNGERAKEGELLQQQSQLRSSSILGDAPFALQQKNQLLEKRLQETELKMQRLKEIFGRKITEFREVCYSLTGYKIEMNDNMFKLSSMFAESEADCLIFQKDAHSNMQLLENEYSASIAQIIHRYLRRTNSIPAILATLTLELFEKQTFL